MPECDWIDDEMARRDRGQIRPLSQDQHAAINARHYPGTRASGNAALLYRLGWRYVGPALSATEIERLRAEVAELREIRKVAGAALRCALSPDSDRIGREGFTEIALAYLAGYGGDWNAMQAAEKGRARGH